MSEPIVCHVTKWYYKRMLLMSAMLLGFAAFFFYDGFIGYPKKNEVIRAHKVFTKAVNERAAFLNGGGSKAEWAKIVEEKRYPEETEWRVYAAKHGWSEKPPDENQHEYRTLDQFICGGLLGLLGLGVLGAFLRNRKQTVRADEGSYVAPNGDRVPFASAYQVDTRKWDNKGLAYVRYRDEAGQEKRAVIDDLKFGGADQILRRLLENFEGELIEKVRAAPAGAPSEAASSPE